MDGATIEPLAPLLLLLNDQTTTQNTEIEVIKNKSQFASKKTSQNFPVRKSGGPKI